MALDIGLHLLGGDPMGFYAQPREIQVDLAAYWRLMNDRESRLRWATMAPARLPDLALHAHRSGLTETVSGLRAWLGANGVRFRSAKDMSRVQSATRALHTANARRCNASPQAVNYWLG